MAEQLSAHFQSHAEEIYNSILDALLKKYPKGNLIPPKPNKGREPICHRFPSFSIYPLLLQYNTLFAQRFFQLLHQRAVQQAFCSIPLSGICHHHDQLRWAGNISSTS